MSQTASNHITVLQDVQTENSTALKKHKGPWCYWYISLGNKSSLDKRPMSLKVYQTPKYCTAVHNNMRQDLSLWNVTMVTVILSSVSTIAWYTVELPCS